MSRVYKLAIFVSMIMCMTATEEYYGSHEYKPFKSVARVANLIGEQEFLPPLCELK